MSEGLTIDLLYFLQQAVSRGASDFHLVAGAHPMARINGSLVPLAEIILSSEDCRSLLLGVLTESQRARLEEDWELDFALQVDGLGRFRANAHFNRGTLEAAFRHIPETIPPLEDLGHAPILRQFCGLEHGLILVTGITGSGKSTTLASMVSLISQSRSGVIISIEDPIEFIFPNSLCLMKQREVGADTKSFNSALRHVLRQDPDVILISEMRDRETIAAAITAAETGHLVLSTLHTIDAPSSIDRLVDVFPADQQSQIVAQLSNSLEAIISQRLLPKKDGSGRVMAEEIMIANPGIRACIRDRKISQLLGLIEIGSREGMQTMDEAVLNLYRQNLISKDETLLNLRDKSRLDETGNQPKKGFFG